MEKTNFNLKNTLIKVGITTVIALLMLIPLTLIRRQVSEREEYHQKSVEDITRNWGGPQTFGGPWLSIASDSGTTPVYPDSLKYVVKTSTQILHRSIFDVSVYSADIDISGDFIMTPELRSVLKGEFQLSMNELKGLQGNPEFTLGEKELKVTSGDKGLKADFAWDAGALPGERVPFRVKMKLNGTGKLYFRPVGNLTEVEMTSDYPDPSFDGDFLPVEREVGENGFTAKWSVSKITVEKPSCNAFGVILKNTVTQYRQAERAVKYGLLIIFLVFIAGFIVEIISGKPINIIQYMVIGASLVLFYSLLLAFSDFISFGISYLIAAGMTTLSLGGYFLAIVKSKWALLLTGLVAMTYGVSYVLLQLETFAFLAGTLVLFVMLCVIMLLTRNLRFENSRLS